MKKIVIPAMLAVVACGSAGAVSIDSLAVRIAEGNPAFAARQAELRAASLDMRADAALPGLEVEGEHLWGRGGDNRWGAGISQSFDWPGVYAAKRRAARASENAFAQLAGAELAEQTLSAKLALIDLIHARKSASVLNGIYNNVRELEQLTSRALDRGQATILDLRKLQIEAMDISGRLQQAEQERAAAIAALRSMGFGEDVPDELDYPSESPDYAEAEARWLASPAIAGARDEAVAASARVSVASRSALPGFSLGYRHQFEGGNHFNGLSASISLPAWGSRKAKAAARAEAENARLQAESVEIQTMAAFEEARRNLLMLKERADRYDSVLGNADYTVLLRKSFDGGQISVLTYIQELNFFMEASLEQQQVEREYNIALATLLKY